MTVLLTNELVVDQSAVSLRDTEFVSLVLFFQSTKKSCNPKSTRHVFTLTTKIQRRETNAAWKMDRGTNYFAVAFDVTFVLLLLLFSPAFLVTDSFHRPTSNQELIATSRLRAHPDNESCATRSDRSGKE